MDNIFAFLLVAILAVGVLVVVRLPRLSPRNLLLGLAGTIAGLLVGALVSVPLSKLPGPFGSLLPIAVTLFVTLVMVGVFINQRQHLAGLAAAVKSFSGQHPTPVAPVDSHEILVDTSVIIDGRIADIAKTGFIPGRLLVPRFVLAELQNIADSDDAMRRGRGRRGLEMLNSIQSTSGINFEIIEDDVPDVREVDAKLVALAHQRPASILTTDYNLNRVAHIEGVKVLNINELSNAIRPVVLPGEEMMVKIVQAGKERNQGVGYLPDGTMIVVESGDKLIGQEVATEVTRVFQTVAGKMIFATPRRAVTNGERSGRKNYRRHGSKPSSHSAHTIEDRLVQDNSLPSEEA